MHIWPFLNDFGAQTCLIDSASMLSSVRIAGHLPPSSSVTGTRFSAAALAIWRPRRAARCRAGGPSARREGPRQLDAADHHIDPVAIERRANHLAQELAAGRRVLRGLDHDAVARRQHLDQRADREVEGEVPGHDVADDALGLGLHVRPAGTEQRRIDLPGSGAIHSSCSAAYTARPAGPSTSIRSAASVGCDPKSLLIAS